MKAMTAWPDGWTKYASLAAALALAVFSQSAFGETAAPVSEDTAALSGWTSVGDDVLAENRGGQEVNLGDLGLNIASNKSTMVGNSVDGAVVTGQITGNSLNNVSGINSVMMNSGNNVSFQNSMQVNIFLK